MTRHLTAEELAELVEGSVTRERAASYQAHIAGCVGCAAALAEAIRYRAAWLRRPQLFGIPEEMTTARRATVVLEQDRHVRRPARSFDFDVGCRPRGP